MGKAQANHAALAAVGMSGLLGWMTTILCLGGVVSGRVAGEAAIHDAFFPAATLSCALLCVVASLPPRGWLAARGGRGHASLVVATHLAGIVATALVGARLFAGIAAYYALGVLVGSCMGVLIVEWLVILSDFDSRAAITVLLVAVIVSLFAFALSHFLRKGANNMTLTCACSIVLLGASGVAWFIARGLAHPIDGNERAAEGMLQRIVAFALVISLCAEFLLAFNVSYGGDEFFSADGVVGMGWGSRMFTERVGCVFCALVICLLLVVLWNTSNRPGFIVLLIYRVIVLSAVMAFGFALAQLARLTTPYLAYSLALLAYFISIAGIWVIAIHAGRLYDNDSVSFLLYAVLFQFLGLFLGHVLATILRSSIQTAPEVAMYTTLGLLALLCMAFLFVFAERYVNRLGNLAAAEEINRTSISTIDGKCDEAAQRYLLTERETEVLKLLARGRNAVSIQEMLVVSYNTVKVHKHNIYVKMDVHSQQELLDVIEGLR